MDKYGLVVSARYVREAGLSNPILVLALAAAVVIGLMYWYFGTESGCSLRATGANAAMARAQGINTSLAKVLGLMISNGLVALSGALLAQYQEMCIRDSLTAAERRMCRKNDKQAHRPS